MKLNIDSKVLNEVTNSLKEVLIKFSNGLVDVFNNMKKRLSQFIYKLAKTIVLQGNRKKSTLGSSCSRKQFLLLKKKAKRFLKEIYRFFGKTPDFSNEDIFTFERVNKNGRNIQYIQLLIIY